MSNRPKDTCHLRPQAPAVHLMKRRQSKQLAGSSSPCPPAGCSCHELTDQVASSKAVPVASESTARVSVHKVVCHSRQFQLDFGKCLKSSCGIRCSAFHLINVLPGGVNTIISPPFWPRRSPMGCPGLVMAYAGVGPCTTSHAHEKTHCNMHALSCDLCTCSSCEGPLRYLQTCPQEGHQTH